MTPKKLPNPKKKNELLNSIIRVDHAGEFGAQRIYQGQLSVLKGDKEIQHMLDQELEHLDFFEKKSVSHKVRPTALLPLWSIGGYMMGKISAMISREAAMAVTVAVEDVIGHHYQEQIDTLNKAKFKDKEFINKLKKFKDDELEHLDAGHEHGARESKFYKLINAIVKHITKSAICISKKY